MIDIKDLKDNLSDLQKEYGYIYDEDDNLIGMPKGLSERDEKIIKLFEFIVAYLEEKELKDSGYYDI